MAEAVMSGMISRFLENLRDMEQSYNMAVATEAETNDKTQDILHAIEFGTFDRKKTAALTRKLQTIRQERRRSKDQIEILAPVGVWCNENRKCIKSLEQLLGAVRKAEAKTQNRSYVPRTGVMEE